MVNFTTIWNPVLTTFARCKSPIYLVYAEHCIMFKHSTWNTIVRRSFYPLMTCLMFFVMTIWVILWHIGIFSSGRHAFYMYFKCAILFRNNYFNTLGRVSTLPEALLGLTIFSIFSIYFQMWKKLKFFLVCIRPLALYRIEYLVVGILQSHFWRRIGTHFLDAVVGYD